MRDACLVGRNFIQERDALPVLENDLQLCPDVLPVILDLRDERKMLIRNDRHVRDERLTAIEPVQQSDNPAAELLDLGPAPSFPLRLALRPAYCLRLRHLVPVPTSSCISEQINRDVKTVQGVQLQSAVVENAGHRAMISRQPDHS